MDQTDVRAGGGLVLFDLSVCVCGYVLRIPDRMDGHYLYFMGIYFLYVHQYSLWIHGFGHFRGSEAPRGAFHLADHRRYPCRAGDRRGNSGGGLCGGGRQYGSFRPPDDRHRRSLQYSGDRLLSALLSACEGADSGGGQRPEAGDRKTVEKPGHEQGIAGDHRRSHIAAAGNAGHAGDGRLCVSELLWLRSRPVFVCHDRKHCDAGDLRASCRQTVRKIRQKRAFGGFLRVRVGGVSALPADQAAESVCICGILYIGLCWAWIL